MTPKCSMIIYPVLNFVLPLMLSSFILVDKPSRCSDCQIKTELRVTENVKIERSQEIDAEVSSLESSAVTKSIQRAGHIKTQIGNYLSLRGRIIYKSSHFQGGTKPSDQQP